MSWVISDTVKMRSVGDAAMPGGYTERAARATGRPRGACVTPRPIAPTARTRATEGAFRRISPRRYGAPSLNLAVFCRYYQRDHEEHRRHQRDRTARARLPAAD